MILDGHIHLLSGADDRSRFEARLRQAGVSGGVLISLPPPSFPHLAPPRSAAARLAGVLEWCPPKSNRFPFFWIDPTEPTALRQVAEAVRLGIRGFKVIADRFDPGDPRAMRVYRRIADANRPILFHSGILWDGKPSSAHTRPLNFEPLLEVGGLRFALAHIGWPWCEELVAVYGKFLNARALRRDRAPELFIDVTPGTPAIRRESALSLVFQVGYDVASNVFFGADSRAGEYSVAWVREWIRRDRSIYRRLGLKPAVVRAIFADNLVRFVQGGAGGPRVLPRPDSRS